MVALCHRCHGAADAGAFTVDDLREMKARGRDRAEALQGRFHWRRRRLVAAVGGNFFYETPIPVQIGSQPVIAFRRDPVDRLLLNVAMPSTVPESRLVIEDNYWIEAGEPDSIECPPSGRLLRVRYPNGDTIGVEFFEIRSQDHFVARYPFARSAADVFENETEGFPLTAVEVRMCVMSPDGIPVIEFDGTKARIGVMLTGCVTIGGAVGVQLG